MIAPAAHFCQPSVRNEQAYYWPRIRSPTMTFIWSVPRSINDLLCPGADLSCGPGLFKGAAYLQVSCRSNGFCVG